MAKGKSGGGGKGKGAATEVKKCSCDHPFTCECGNRPERPSRGHKWDPETQAWGGKGHKQKGASGQIAQVSQKAVTTEVGKTQVAQWQRLPTQLLQEVCQRQKRKPPKFKNVMEGNNNKFKYRVIVPDPKGDAEKDMFFVSALAVENEEQAHQEAALLALLHLTPDLPHERKLPDPYKTTWLNAIEQRKKAATAKDTKAKTPSSNNNKSNSETDAETASITTTTSLSSSTADSKTAASASSNLMAATSFLSQADRRKQQEEKRRQQNERIRHHEAIRLANLNHPVFLSARLRQQIEALIRGDYDSLSLNDIDRDGEDEEDNEEPVDISDVQQFVEERLHAEGFAKRQARTAFQENARSNISIAGISEENWDSVYEKCLQWLLVHLDEDKLPVGFSPVGGTLDVISAATAATPSSTLTSVAKDFAKRYGLALEDAIKVEKYSKENSCSMEDAFWVLLHELAGIPYDASSSSGTTANHDELNGELEVLESMYSSPDEYTVEQQTTAENNNDSLTVITIKNVADTTLNLKVAVKKGEYPNRPPSRVLVEGDWSSQVKEQNVSVAVHVELVTFLSTLPLGEPMVFEINNQVHTLLETAADLEKKSLSGIVQNGGTSKNKTQTQTAVATQENTKSTKVRPRIHRRLRERGPFWSKPPSQTPPAIPFPSISASLKKQRGSLPAATARSDFLSILRQAEKGGGRVMLVTGDTGCGKTTQIPQFILEEAPNDVKIVVAQPRRLAATGVAARVATERGEDAPGKGSVGYVVRGDSAINNTTRLLFCTTGVLLRQLQSEAALDCITHIIVDEVHERQLDTDILLGLLKKILPHYPNLRVVLMSATLDADKFAAYWGANTPRMHIPGRTFPVTDYTLEDVLLRTGYVPPRKEKGKNSSEQKEADGELDPDQSIDGVPVEELVKRIDESSIDYTLLARLVKYLVSTKGMFDDGSILVFLPGAPEINEALETIKRFTRDLPVFLLPLHGGLQPKEQNRVFQPPPSGLKKVVLSTNICETSVTIPDCTIVIDTAREKQSSYDPANRMPLLVEQFASRASLKQRRGRAGRVREGVCYKLISRSTLAGLKEHSDPEIRRCALDQTLLALLYLGVENGAGTFMRTLMDPPSAESSQAAAYSLLQVGAVEAGEREEELRLTPLGMHLAQIPAPPSIGKLLVMGAILGCRSSAVAMAAGMSAGRSPFLRVEKPRRRRKNDDEPDTEEEIRAKEILEERSRFFAKVGNSDHALIAALYKEWGASSSRKNLCDRFGLSFPGMKEMAQLASQLDSALSSAGYGPSDESERNANSWRILRACAVAAMSPSQLVKVVRPAAQYVQTAEGAQEKDGEARGLKFFIRTEGCSTRGVVDQNESKFSNEERVFIHPSSANFTVGTFSCPWLVYHSLVRTSKPFLRDVTECNAYALLLFGGSLEVQASKSVIVVDGWTQLSANARIGSLVGGLRRKVDELMTEKIRNPSFEIESTKEMHLIVKLIKTDGLGT